MKLTKNPVFLHYISKYMGILLFVLKYVTWSRGMSQMSGILILSYRLKQVINSYVLHYFWIWRIVHISATRCLIEMGFGSKCSILNGQVIDIEKSELNIADMWLIPLDRVTYMYIFLLLKMINGFSWPAKIVISPFNPYGPQIPTIGLPSLSQLSPSSPPSPCGEHRLPGG